ncbi:MAG: transposase [Deltaproteobacteria bacterium]|nr:transposase [Deltaproteobacteria bacterium]MBW2595289.1 transposase [Deltaproteobacteria bacterium]MBW2651172.1 transposase [Deltaproteobacteria bacterium]
MARPLRIEYPGAWYHVMNRGRSAEKIFRDRHDYQVFIKLLEESSEMWNIRVAAYCLMTNHYHILVQTPDANIARSMRHINGVYTQKFNRRHLCDGQLFRGRYKSILVGGDSYLLQLVRYIHRNPVKAGIANTPDDYLWSSHKGYLSVTKKWKWLYRELILSMLTKNRKEWVKEYRKFISIEKDEEMADALESEKWPSVLGPERFIDWVKGKYYAVKADQEVPQAQYLAPEAELIINAVCKFYNISRDELYRSRRGQFNEPRNVAIFLNRKLRHDSLKEIALQFHMEKYSSISSIIERMKKQMLTDSTLKGRVDRVAKGVSKSQEQT